MIIQLSDVRKSQSGDVIIVDTKQIIGCCRGLSEMVRTLTRWLNGFRHGHMLDAVSDMAGKWQCIRKLNYAPLFVTLRICCTK